MGLCSVRHFLYSVCYLCSNAGGDNWTESTACFGRNLLFLRYDTGIYSKQQAGTDRGQLSAGRGEPGRVWKICSKAVRKKQTEWLHQIVRIGNHLYMRETCRTYFPAIGIRNRVVVPTAILFCVVKIAQGCFMKNNWDTEYLNSYRGLWMWTSRIINT